MRDYFENDIDGLGEDDFSDLEDLEVPEVEVAHEDFVYPERLFRLKLEYSCEGLYAIAPEGMELCGGDYVIIPTKYGRDYARVMGPVSRPVGIKPSDIIAIDRKASDEDMAKAEDLKEKESSAFKIFQEKAANHKLDMKLIAVHYLLEEQKVLFFFSADKRVDFRELVKDLAQKQK